MATVEIDSQSYPAYADVGTADLYLAAASHADSWRLLDDVSKARALVTSARILDRQSWLGDYDTVAEREVVQNIIDASIELALALVDGSDVQNQASTITAIRSMSAGSVSITNFRNATLAARFPNIVQELLRDYLGGSDLSYAAKATGVDGESIFPDLDLGFSGGL